MKVLPLFALAFAATASTQTPVADLAVPPGDAQHFVIISPVSQHGESARWMTAAGVHRGRESLFLRGQRSELDSASHLGLDKMLDQVTVRGFTPTGDVAESFAIAGQRATWKSPVDSGTKAYAAPAEYIAKRST